MSENKVVKLPKLAKDILPKDHRYFTYFKKVARHRCRQAGYRRFTTPVFEKSVLFDKAYHRQDEINRDGDILLNLNGEDLTLVSDRFPSVVRSYLEHHMIDWPQPVELYHIEPIFRKAHNNTFEHSQMHCFGVDILGEVDPAIDAQVIQLLTQILDDLGVLHLFKLRINNVGSHDDKHKYATALQDYFIGKERYLDEEGNYFLHNDPLRLLTIEDEDVKILAELAPKYEQFLSKDSVEYFEKLKDYLSGVNVDFEVDEKFFPSAPYFTHSVFCFEAIGPVKGLMCHGGRYDGLAIDLGAEEQVPGFGGCMNVDGVIQVMRKAKIDVPSKDELHIFVAQLGDEAKKKCLSLITDLRDAGIKCVGALGKGSMKEQLRLAQQFRVPYTILMGITEVKEGVVIIRNMAKGTQEKFPYDKAVEETIKLIGEGNLDTYHPGELIYT